jgi:hypothetical protein
VIYIDRQKAEIRLNELVKGIFCKRVIQQKSGEMDIDLPIFWDNTMVLSIGIFRRRILRIVCDRTWFNCAISNFATKITPLGVSKLQSAGEWTFH